jgi:hypothetical protein
MQIQYKQQRVRKHFNAANFSSILNMLHCEAMRINHPCFFFLAKPTPAAICPRLLHQAHALAAMKYKGFLSPFTLFIQL